jgi:hypothetical protein
MITIDMKKSFATSMLNLYLKKSLAYPDSFTFHDVINYKHVPMLRGRLKNYVPINSEKPLNGFNIQNNQIDKSPFEILNLIPNQVQETLLKSDFKNNGSYLFNISCGGGKTLLSIELIHRYKLKTLIISARSAVNDQWLSTLKRVYPQLKIRTRLELSNKKEKLNDVDIYIITPQYISKYIEDFQNHKDVLSEYKFDFIIYDEIHSLLSNKFSSVLILPFVLKFLKIIKHLPYMLGLTASLPANTTPEYELLNSIFGKPITLQSEITRIPVDYVDFRDLVSEADRKKYDYNYNPYDSNKALLESLKYMEEHNIKPSVDYKLIIITPEIDESVYAALTACSWFDLPTIIVRSSNEIDYYIDPKKIPDEYQEMETLNEEDKPSCMLEVIKDLEFMEECRYADRLNTSGIIVGTIARLKEGFNCENICFGICTQFIYSDVSRVQILGRIRRSSTNPLLNDHTRLFILNSGRVPSDLMNPHRRKMKLPVKLLYSFEREKQLFDAENYVKRDINKYVYHEYRSIKHEPIREPKDEPKDELKDEPIHEPKNESIHELKDEPIHEPKNDNNVIDLNNIDTF